MVMQIQKNYLKKQRNKKGNLDLKPEEENFSFLRNYSFFRNYCYWKINTKQNMEKDVLQIQNIKP